MAKTDCVKQSYKIVLAGNPNVGKSTVFNCLTGLKQHTGNWTGKTVDHSSGEYMYKNTRFEITDLPGAYSLLSFSAEEALTKDYLTSGNFDCAVIVVDANSLQRNLAFALQVLSYCDRAVICLNMADEAKRNGMEIDIKELSKCLGAPAVSCCASKKQGLSSLAETILSVCKANCAQRHEDTALENMDFTDEKTHMNNIYALNKISEETYSKCVKQTDIKKVNRRTEKIDKILTSKLTGIPIMLLLFLLLFWLTVAGANYPSELLSNIFEACKVRLSQLFQTIGVPMFIKGLLIDGVYTTLSWVVSVMLPPMAIFFPLFSLIEDSGYLPRIAFNFDKAFAKCGAHGKQSLTMAMGIGCNACGVTGCRIIESPAQRLIAILTNNFMPCNGRFPILIAIVTVFFADRTDSVKTKFVVAFSLVLIVVFAVLITLAVSKLLSVTVAKGMASGFTLELPPYRKPQILKTILGSMRDKTLRVLGRAAAVAAPAGALIWLCANLRIGNNSILELCSDFLNPFGEFLGLDGVILMAFILGFPANETVIPIMIMSYLSQGTLTELSGYEPLRQLLIANGWTAVTAVCVIIITLLHFPCSTTCLTIKKETHSIKTTLLSFALPTLCGIIMCAATAGIMRLFI